MRDTPDDYPRHYPLSTGAKLLFGLMGTALTLGGLFGIWYFATGHETRGGMVALTSGFFILGLVLVAAVLRSQIVLFADRIELHALISVKQMNRDRIEGRRQNRSDEGRTLIERETGRRMVLASVFRTDEVLDRWIAALPDLDARDVEASTREAAADTRLGATEEERLERLGRGKAISRSLSIATIGVGLWGTLFPRPYELAVVVLMVWPWIALAIAWSSRGLYRLEQQKNEARPNLAVPLLFPGVALALMAIRSFHLLDARHAMIVAAGVGLVLLLCMISADSTLLKQPLSLLGFVLASAAYGYGGGMCLNVILDRSTADVYPARVLSKHETHGKGASRDLVLAAWGTKQEEERVRVGKMLYENAQVGGTVCVVVQKGAFGIGWYRVGFCR